MSELLHADHCAIAQRAGSVPRVSLRVVWAFNAHSAIARLLAIPERARLKHANGWASASEKRANGFLQMLLRLEVASGVHGGAFCP